MSESTVNIGAYKTRFNGKMGRFKRAVLIKLFGSVIKDTPVLTGRLRANWTFEKSINDTDHSKKATDKDGSSTVSTVVGQINQEVNEKDGTYCLSNSLPYVGRIEYNGWSHTKAPQGMVRKNLVRIAKNLKEHLEVK